MAGPGRPRLGPERVLGHGGERERRLAAGPRAGARQGRGAGRPGWAGGVSRPGGEGEKVGQAWCAGWAIEKGGEEDWWAPAGPKRREGKELGPKRRRFLIC